MTRERLVLSLLIAGLCIFGIGQTWNRLVPTSAYWGNDQAQEYIATQAKLHSITDRHRGHSHGNSEQRPEHQRELAAVRERFLELNNQLERARDLRGQSGKLLTMVGAGAILLGIGVHFASRRAS